MKLKAHDFSTSVKQPHTCCFTYGLGLLMRMLHARVKIDGLNYCRLYLILIISLHGHDAYFDHKPFIFHLANTDLDICRPTTHHLITKEFIDMQK